MTFKIPFKEKESWQELNFLNIAHATYIYQRRFL